MILSLIVAAAENDVIGRGNTLPWDLPDDLAYFRRVTKGKTVICGRKTAESIIQKLGGPLPNRRTIVISRQEDLEIEGCEVVDSVDGALELVRGEEEVFVIGGEQIYALFLTRAERLYLTRIHTEIEGDAVFPEWEEGEWEEVRREEHSVDEKHASAFTFLVYERRDV